MLKSKSEVLLYHFNFSKLSEQDKLTKVLLLGKDINQLFVEEQRAKMF